MSTSTSGMAPAPLATGRGARWAHEDGFDAAMRRLLRVPEVRRRVRGEAVYRTFSTGMVLSGLRCLLTYVFLPVVSPALGLATGAGPWIGVPLSLVALVFDVIGVRRFWLADHRYRRPMTAVYLAVMALVTSLLVVDLVHLAH
ncbi:MAG TPA: hypothetical protein VNF07_03645 [Acidimicrobiales bacterium]|nr:hypothetical protein [Acidimicrobiales bacterium]